MTTDADVAAFLNAIRTRRLLLRITRSCSSTRSHRIARFERHPGARIEMRLPHKELVGSLVPQPQLVDLVVKNVLPPQRPRCQYGVRFTALIIDDCDQQRARRPACPHEGLPF